MGEGKTGKWIDDREEAGKRYGNMEVITGIFGNTEEKRASKCE